MLVKPILKAISQTKAFPHIQNKAFCNPFALSCAFYTCIAFFGASYNQNM